MEQTLRKEHVSLLNKMFSLPLGLCGFLCVLGAAVV